MNWKTTVCGIATILAAVGSAVAAFLDGNAATNPDWTATLAAVTAGFGLIFAKDNTTVTK